MTLQIHIPTRSPAGLAALDIFYANFNDINFYVEDTDQENLYHEIFRKYFPEIKIEKIFPLGGKKPVLDHAKDPVNKKDKTEKIYLLDKDFDDLLGTIEIIENAFYLDRYCIENHLVDEAAIVTIVLENHPKLSRNEIETTLDLGAYIKTAEQQLRQLFLLFFSVQLFKLGLKNCSSKPEEFCKKKKLWEIDNTALNSYKDLVLKKALASSIAPPFVDPMSDERIKNARTCAAGALISGKFLLAMIFHYTKSKYSLGSSTFDSFVYRVARNSNLTSLQTTISSISMYLARPKVRKRKSSTTNKKAAEAGTKLKP